MDNTAQAKPPSAAQNLVKLIKQLVVERQYDGVALLFTSATEAQRNLESLKDVASDVLHEVCLEQLNDKNYENNMPLYNCVEELLLLLAANGPAEELLLELLEMVEAEKSDNVFTSTLKALQTVLFRLLDTKPRAFEWSLNSIQSRISEYPVPAYLTNGYDLKQQRLLEQDEEVQRLLMSYITVGLFYEPLLSKLNKMTHTKIFRPNGIDSRNVLCCFLVQLLGRPLALLDLSTSDTQQSNTYTLQCARNITKAVTECIGDPLYLLSYVEQRVRWKPRLDASKGVYEMSSNNIFLIDEKLPLVGLAIYYYMLLVEGVTLECVPKVYSPLYIFESGLYLATELFSQAEPALHYRGLLLGKRLVEQLQQHQIPAIQLELSVHKFFCHELCNIVGYSPQTHLRQNGVQLLRAYILQFDDEGKYLILNNLLRSIHHTGIAGYLAVVYKDLVANALLQTDTKLPNFYSGADFRSIFLQNICHLPNGAETDLIEHADKLISSLNALRFFVLKDCENRTGIWSFIEDVKKQFMTPLRQGLDMSMAHYANELKCVEQGLDVESEEQMRERMKLLDVNIANDKEKKNKCNVEFDRQRKMEILNQHMCALDLIRSLLGRATECVENPARNSCENCQNSLQPVSIESTTNTIALLLRHQRTLCRNYSTEENKSCNRLSSGNQFTLPQRYFSSISPSTANKAPTDIDEFRAREEQREEDFERQQADNESKAKADAEDEAKRAKVEVIRQKILAAGLEHVKQHGWTRQAIVQGAEDVGLPSVVHGMFPEGGFALVSYFTGHCNEELLKRLQAETEDGKHIPVDPVDFLVRSVRARLEMLVPYKMHWPQALGLIALPPNASTALAQVLTLVDDICYYSGDRSVDIGWYTRRIGLATIMKMTELFMLQDSSAEHAKTWEFLRNRMDEAVQLQMMLSQGEGMTHSLQRSFNSAFITARNILGLGYNR